MWRAFCRQAGRQAGRTTVFLVVILSVVLAIGSASANVGGYAEKGAGNWDMSATITGNGPNDVVAVAEKQLGKSKSTLGYTGAWCAAFVNDVFKIAGQESAAPFVSGKTHGVVGLRSEVLSRGGTTVSASAKQKGDFIFYYCNSCGCWVHVGICYDNGNTRIEGNVGGVVKKHTGGYMHYWENKSAGTSGYHYESNGEVTLSYVRPNYNNKNYGYLDVNGYLDGVNSGSIGSYGTFDIRVGSDTSNDVNDYYSRLEKGTSYEISDIKANPGYEFLGFSSGGYTGTVSSTNTIDVRLIFATKGNLHIYGNLDGIVDESTSNYGTFDVYINDVLSASNCTSYNEKLPTGTRYEIKNIKAVTGKNYDGITSFTGTVTSNTESKVTLAYSSDGTATPDWQVGKAVPGNLDKNTLDIEYKYTYTQQGRTSPGDDWTMIQEGAVQYENDGAPYYSDNPQATSATRVLVGHYYFHYCNNGTNANYYQKDYLPIKHTISMEDVSNFTVEYWTTDGDGSGRKVYRLIHKNGEWAGGYAKCGTNGSQVYYEGDVYQNKKAYRINTYQKVGDWKTELDTTATSVEYRIRLKHYPVIFEVGDGTFDTVSLIKYSGVDLTLPDSRPTRELYEFIGWNTEPDGTGRTYQPGDVYEENEDTYLYARWKELASAMLPSGLDCIEEEAFAGINAVIVRIPASCTEIKSRAFLNCSNLRRIYIPANTSKISVDAFDGCVNLKIIAPAGSTAIKVAKYNDIPYEEVNDQ